MSTKTALIGSAVAAVAITAGVVVAISASGSSSPKLSVAQVHAAAARLGDHGTACPLRFDRAAAARAAGADAPLVPAADADDVAYGQVPDGTEADSAAARFGMSSVGCDFTTTVHGTPVTLEVQVFAAAKGSVLNAVAPILQHDAEVPMSTLTAFYAQKLPVGQVRTVQGDAAASVGRFDPDGPGDVVVEVAQVLSAQDKPAPVRFQALTEKLLGQITL